MQPFIVGVGGFTSNVGKTTLMCDLLRAFPGWEAIKTTRGHYRSCGKDAEACCVSHLLGEEPIIRSGREDTYESGKDTGRYWDAGAANVHWLIATESQLEKGISQALSRVRAAGVFVEGNMFSRFVAPDYFVMVRRKGLNNIKKSAKAMLSHSSALFISDLYELVSASDSLNAVNPNCPMFGPLNFNLLVSTLRTVVAARHTN